MCEEHGEPVIYYSMPYAKFICYTCYDTIRDKSECYGIDELGKIVDRVYHDLLQYIEENEHNPTARYRQQQVHQEVIKAYLQKVREERYPLLTEHEKSLLDKAITDI